MENNASRVLIVDDLPANRMILSSLLASRGVISDQAEGGYACLDLVRENDYDLILLDHRMPDLEGVDTLTQLKEIFKEKKKSIPVICHTTEEGSKNINLYKAAGFADVLIKPIDPAQLSEVIMEYLPIEVEKDNTDLTFSLSFNPVTEEFKVPEEDDMRDELDKLPLWLKIVPHIDLNAGIAGCGSAEDYIDALYVFRSSIDEKSADIESYLVNRDWTMYRLGVHSLKSMARLVGARNLAQMAAAMEEYAESENYTKIKDGTADLLQEYRRFNKLLDPLMEDEDIRHIMEDATDRAREANAPAHAQGNERNILFISSNQGIVGKGIE